MVLRKIKLAKKKQMSCNLSLNEMKIEIEKFSKKLKPGTIITFHGPIGAGKTTFVSSLAKELGYEGQVSSPTYAILNQYDNIMIHIDAYRISEEDLDIDKYVDEGYIICIEWSENISTFIPHINYEIHLDYTEDFNKRVLTIKGE